MFPHVRKQQYNFLKEEITFKLELHLQKKKLIGLNDFLKIK